MLWFEVFLGVWIMLSPWLLGYSGDSIMVWSNLIAGLGVFLVSLWAIFGRAGADEGKG